MGTGSDFDGIKRPGHKADHPTPCSEVKNGGAICPLPHTSSWHSAWLVKHRENFTFTFTNNVRVKKSISIISEGYIVRMEMRYAYKIFVGYT
jgi:hypothetical protein